MSIEIVGPARYEFQYASTLVFALTHLDDVNTQLVVEPSDGEDFTLVMGAGTGAAMTVEGQVKSSVAGVDLHTVAEWLVQYPSGVAERSLVSRVASDKQRLVVFLTGGRCTDELRRPWALIAQTALLVLPAAPAGAGLVSSDPSWSDGLQRARAHRSW